MKKSTKRSTAGSREVFVDTSGLYALIDRQDALHPAARTRVELWLREGGRLVTTDAVVSETLTLARMRSGPLVALRVLDLIEQSVGLRLEWVGTSRFDAAKAFLRRHTTEHRYSFTDCTSFIVMRELRLELALTSDRHFAEAGFEALLA
jgi:uncharacterized protein